MERFRRVDAVAMAVALVGMSLFFVGRLDPGALAGNLVAVVSGFFFGLVILFLRRDAAGDAIPSVIAGNFLAAALALPFAFGHLALDGAGSCRAVPRHLPTGIGYVLFMRDLRRYPAAEASLLGMLEPMFAHLSMPRSRRGLAVGSSQGASYLSRRGRTVSAGGRSPPAPSGLKDTYALSPPPRHQRRGVVKWTLKNSSRRYLTGWKTITAETRFSSRGEEPRRKIATARKALGYEVGAFSGRRGGRRRGVRAVPGEDAPLRPSRRFREDLDAEGVERLSLLSTKEDLFRVRGCDFWWLSKHPQSKPAISGRAA
jgi:hypothetical protein